VEPFHYKPFRQILEAPLLRTLLALRPAPFRPLLTMAASGYLETSRQRTRLGQTIRRMTAGKARGGRMPGGLGGTMTGGEEAGLTSLAMGSNGSRIFRDFRK
jgi:hypothetical protein